MTAASETCEERSTERLLSCCQVDPGLWLNEHVRSAYRPPNQPARVYIKSIFEWNNETINIWTHLLGFLYFSWLQLHANFLWLPSVGASRFDHVVATIAIFGSQMCMLLSTAYHVFGCASVSAREQWLRCDVFGISAGLLSMYLMGIYTAFLCFQEWQTRYMTILLGLFAITTYAPSRDEIVQSKLFGTRIGYLHLTYIATVAFGLCPTIHCVQLHGGLGSSFAAMWLPSIVVLYTLLTCGFFFYASMIPERFYPGAFDVLGYSHQWWHVLILAAMVLWHRSGLLLLSYHRSYPQHCLASTSVPSNVSLGSSS